MRSKFIKTMLSLILVASLSACSADKADEDVKSAGNAETTVAVADKADSEESTKETLTADGLTEDAIDAFLDDIDKELAEVENDLSDADDLIQRALLAIEQSKEDPTIAKTDKTYIAGYDGIYTLEEAQGINNAAEAIREVTDWSIGALFVNHDYTDANDAFDLANIFCVTTMPGDSTVRSACLLIYDDADVVYLGSAVQDTLDDAVYRIMGEEGMGRALVETMVVEETSKTAKVDTFYQAILGCWAIVNSPEAEFAFREEYNNLANAQNSGSAFDAQSKAEELMYSIIEEVANDPFKYANTTYKWVYDESDTFDNTTEGVLSGYFEDMYLRTGLKIGVVVKRDEKGVSKDDQLDDALNWYKQEFGGEALGDDTATLVIYKDDVYVCLGNNLWLQGHDFLSANDVDVTPPEWIRQLLLNSAKEGSTLEELTGSFAAAVAVFFYC